MTAGRKTLYPPHAVPKGAVFDPEKGGSKCAKHGYKFIALNERHDGTYCAACGVWLETKCSDRACRFCKGRPVRAPKGAK